MTDLGFDEGGVLQALATPILHQEVTTVKTSKKGKVTTSKTVFELTGAQVVAALLGANFLALFLKYKDLSEDEKRDFRTLLLFGPISGPWINRHRPSSTPLANEKERLAYQACQFQHGMLDAEGNRLPGFGPLSPAQMKECGL